MFLCSISPVHSLAEEQEGYGVVHSLFFPSSCIPLCYSFRCWLSKSDYKLVKAIFQNTSPPPLSPTAKTPSAKVLWGPDVSATLLKGFMCVIPRESETCLLDIRLHCHENNLLKHCIQTQWMILDKVMLCFIVFIS